ncbi:MAG: sugar phosphate nucleotidyltransferase, partial [Candidatus Omnitrophota bacterium]
LAGDHVYKMNYYTMIDYHWEVNADLTVGVVEMDKSNSEYLGVMEVDKSGRVKDFLEKPKNPKPIPGQPNKIYASMGIYVFNRSVLEEQLKEDSRNNKSGHDFGKDIIPQMVKDGLKVVAYNFVGNSENKKELPYWRDIGTIEAYYEANMDLVQAKPVFNLYDKAWPIRTYQEQFPPAKTVFAGEEITGRVGLALDSLVSSGCVISGGQVKRSILSPNVKINSYAQVDESILMEGVIVGRYARIKRTIIDKDVNIPEGTVIGYDLKEDKKKFTVTESGIVVVAKRTEIKQGQVPSL